MAADGLLSRITTDPGIFGGKPIIRGMRVSVEHILKALAAGVPEQELPADIPILEPDDIRACLAYASPPRPGAGTRAAGPPNSPGRHTPVPEGGSACPTNSQAG